MVSRGVVPSLTGLRFYAAACILVSHTAGAVFYPGQVPILKHASALGYLGMTLFFVLSGFVIHYNYGALLATPSVRGIWSFAVARFARLYPLFFFAFVLSLCFPGSLPDTLPDYWVYYVTLTHDWFNLKPGGTLLGDLYAPASWSISAEVFLYLLYVPLAGLIAKLDSPRAVLRAIMALAVMAMLFQLVHVPGSWGATDPYWFYYRSPYARLPEFLLGALTAQLYSQPRDKAAAVEREACLWLIVVFAVVAVALLFSSAFAPLSARLEHLRMSWGLAPFCAAVMYYLSRFETRAGQFFSGRLPLALGDASYSIYLLHGYFIWMITVHGIGTSWLMATKVIVAWALIGFTGIGAYQCFEAPARHAIRRALKPWRAAAPIAVPAE